MTPAERRARAASVVASWPILTAEQCGQLIVLLQPAIRTRSELADALSLIMEEVGTGAMVKVHVIAENNKPYADGDYSTTNVAAISGFLVQNKEVI